MAPILALLVASATGLTGTATTPTGRLLAMHRRASPPVALAAREARLHGIARRAALQGNDDDAQKAYELAISRWGSGRSFLLAALLQSRLGLEEQTRETFRRGICLHPKDASLIQAWGLFESKHGEVQRALRGVKLSERTPLRLLWCARSCVAPRGHHLTAKVSSWPVHTQWPTRLPPAAAATSRSTW